MGSMFEQVSDQLCGMEASGRAPMPGGLDAGGPDAGGPDAGGLGEDGRRLLAEAVRMQVIPLLAAMPGFSRPRAPASEAAVDEQGVRRLLELSLDDDAGSVAAHVAGLRRAGVPAEAIYDGLLTPVARRLGVMWENDECSFADVTIGVLRLQNAQRALSPDFVSGPGAASGPGVASGRMAGVGAPRVVLFPVPGEQHTFGLSMVLDFFRRTGWHGVVARPDGVEGAASLVARERPDLVGVSVGSDENVIVAEAVVRRLRDDPGNSGMVVMVGGPSFLADPGLAERIGAHGTALNGQQAVLRANELLHRVAGRA